ncbi:hypothetical protein [Agathobaculum sp. Marseille-P7918]
MEEGQGYLSETCGKGTAPHDIKGKMLDFKHFTLCLIHIGG